jgi:hypothetical protein
MVTNTEATQTHTLQNDCNHSKVKRIKNAQIYPRTQKQNILPLSKCLLRQSCLYYRLDASQDFKEILKQEAILVIDKTQMFEDHSF